MTPITPKAFKGLNYGPHAKILAIFFKTVSFYTSGFTKTTLPIRKTFTKAKLLGIDTSIMVFKRPSEVPLIIRNVPQTFTFTILGSSASFDFGNGQKCYVKMLLSEKLVNSKLLGQQSSNMT